MDFFSKNINFTSKILFLLLAGYFSFSCNPTNRQKGSSSSVPQQNELQQIRKSGVLRAAVDYNSTNYFVYRGKPMGFKYELLQALCEDLGVNLQIIVSNNLAETFDGLINNRFDVVAKNLTVTKQRNEMVDFTVPLEQTRQVLVQRKKDKELPDSVYLNSVLDLAGKKVHVQKNTAYYDRLENLSEEIKSSTP